MSIATGIAMGIASSIASSIVAGEGAAPEPGPVVLSLANNNGRFTEGPTGTWSNSTPDAQAQADRTLDGDGYVMMERSGTVNDTVVMSFGTSSGLAGWQTLPWGVFMNSGTYQCRDNGSDINTGVAVATGDKVRLRRAGSQITAEKSSDSGVSWTLLRTYSTTTSAQLYIKFNAVLGSRAVLNPMGLGTTAIAALLIFFGFESNSGGQVYTTELTANELAPSTSLYTMRPDTLQFQLLDIGTNNNLDHANVGSDRVGWHTELKNRVEAGDFGSRPVYMCETGQGSSTVAQWAEGGTYWTKLIARMDAAVAQVTALHGAPTIVGWISHGINDELAGTTEAAYKAGELELLGRINTRYGVDAWCIDNVPAAGSRNYRTVIPELAAELGNAAVQDFNAHHKQDQYHLSYSGMATMVQEKVSATLAALA